MRPIHPYVLLSLSLVAAAPSHARVAYKEASSGDLSGTRASPTKIELSDGSNQVFGTTGSGLNGIDRDYFWFKIAPGFQLASIVLLPGTTVNGAVSFIGFQPGEQVTVSPTGATAVGLAGWTLYAPADINSDILGKMSTPSRGSSGFTPPLAAGSYAFWVQDTLPGAANYGFDFKISPAPVPLPGGLLLFASGAGLLRLARRRVG